MFNTLNYIQGPAALQTEVTYEIGGGGGGGRNLEPKNPKKKGF